MLMNWIYHGRISSVVDSSAIPVSFLKEAGITKKMFLQGKSKFSPKEQFLSIVKVS